MPTSQPAIPAHLAAHLSLAATVLFVLLVASLHRLKPALPPAHHMISEYARGPRGWLMRAAFSGLAIACLALALPTWAYTHSGASLLIGAAIGAAGAGAFTTDPPSISREASTPAGVLHAVFSFVFIPVFPVAATVVSHAMQHSLPWWSAATWIGLLAFIGSPLHGAPAGYAQRLMVATYAAWLVMAAQVLG